MMKRLFTFFMLLCIICSISAQTVVYNEDFETPPFGVTATGNPLWSVNTNLSNSGLQSYHNTVATNDTSFLTTNSFSTSGNSFVILDFAHICKVHIFDGAYIEVSVDNGVSWIRLTGSEYLGSGQFGTLGNRFVSASYPGLWQANDNNAIPDNTWWRQESFDISAIAGNQANVQIRFVLFDGNNPPGNSGNYGWLIDDIQVTVMEFLHDLAVDSIYSPQGNFCYDGNESVTIQIGNYGLDTIFGGFQASYTVDGGPAVTETVPHTIAPNENIIYTFNTPINFVLPGEDSTFILKAYVDASNDPFSHNDTLDTEVTFLLIPPSPSAINDTVVYGSSATLSVVSNFHVNWYATPSLADDNVLDTGAVFITPPLYGNTAYYAAASSNTGGFIITEICHFKTSNGQPTGGWPPYLIADDYIEITGPPGGDLSGYTLEMWTATAIDNAQTLGPGTVLSPDGTAIIATGQLTSSVPSPSNFYYHSGNTSSIGSGTAQGYILRDLDGVIIDAVGYPGSSSYTFPTAAGVDPAQFALSWSPGSGSGTSGTRLVGDYTGDDSNWVVSSSAHPQDPNEINPNVEPPVAGCESIRTPVWAIVTNNPPVDAGVVSIDEPVSPTDLQPQPLVVSIQNFGTDPLTSVTINWTHNGNPQTSYNWTGNLQLSERDSVTIGTLSPSMGNNFIVAWTTSPNGLTDPMASNDTASRIIEAYEALCGIYTIGHSGANFSSFADAIYALEYNGVTCPVVFEVQPGTYNERIELSSGIPGVTASNTVSFVGEPGAILSHSPLSSTERSAVSLNGASYYRFENLEIQLDPLGDWGWGFYLGPQTENVEIRNCKINVLPNATSTNYAGIVASGSATSPTSQGSGIKNIIIEDNIFNGGYYGIVFYGSSSSHAEDITIKRNEFNHINYYGIRFAYVTEPIVTHNNIRMSPAGHVSSRGFDLWNVTGPIAITHNRITHQGIYGIYLSNVNAPPATPSLIANNAIGGGFRSTGTGTSGIYITSSSNIDIYYNSINCDAIAGRTFYALSSASGLRIMNNSFVYASPGSGYAMYVTSASSVTQLDHNNYYSEGTNFVFYGANRTSLTALQNVNNPAGNDQNSVTGDPIYIDVDDLYPLSTVLYESASPITGIVDDITGTTRSTVNPSIGAYEFTPATNDIALVSAHLERQICLSNNDSIFITIRNIIGDTIVFSNDPLTAVWQVNGPVNSNGTVLLNTGTLAEKEEISFGGGNVDLSVPGIYVLDVYLEPNAVNNLAMNDTLWNAFTIDVLPYSFSIFPDSAHVSSSFETVQLNVNSNMFPGGGFIITEICHFRGTTIGAPVGGWPSYLIADDYIEITGVPGSDLGGYTLEQWEASLTSTHTFPSGTVLSPNGTAVIAVGQLGSSVPSPANYYYHGTGNFTGSFGSNTPVGRIIRDPQGQIVDAVVYGTYDFPTAAGVSPNDWTGYTSITGSAGIRLEGPYTKDATHWVNSNISPQDPNTLNSGVSLPAASSIDDFSWSLNGVITSLNNPDTIVGPFSINGLYEYVATYDGPCGLFIDTARVYVNIPTYDLFIDSIISPEGDLCYDGNEPVSILVGNLGSDTLFGGFTASYTIDGGSVVSEVMNDIIPPGSLVPVSFSQDINFSLVGMDSTFYLNTFVNIVGDNNPYNDTLGASYKFSFVPDQPVGVNDTIAYASTATLEAISNYSVQWYSSPYSQTVLDTGNFFTTPVLYGNTPYYATTMSGTGGFIITEICHFKTSTGQPIGGWPSYLIADDYIEITGPPGGDLSGYTLEMWTASALNNAQVLGPSTVLSPDGTAIIAIGQLGSSVPSPANYYYHSGNTTTMGSGTAQGYILKDTDGVIVDAVGYPGGSSFTFPPSAGLDPSEFSLTWSPGSATSTSGTRLEGPYTGDDTHWLVSSAAHPQDPNILNNNVELPVAGCESSRTEVWAIVTGNPPIDAGVVSVDQPVSPTNLQPQNLFVSFQNFGSDPLTSVDINWTLNGVLQTSFSWSGNLSSNQTESVNIGSFTPNLGVNDLVVWTSNPNNTIDPTPSNDTLYATIEAYDALCGTYYVGLAPGANFPTLADAAFALENYGITCPVTIVVMPGFYSERLELGQIPGASSVNTVTFRGQPGAVLTYTPSSTSERAAVYLSGASHIIIDSLRIELDHTEDWGWGVYMGDNTTNITISNCYLDINATATSINYSGIVASGSPTSPTTMASGISNITIKNNTIVGGYYGVVFYGSSTSPVENPEVIGNQFLDTYYYGLRFYYTSQAVAKHNYIDMRQPAPTASRGIDCSVSNGPVNFSNNIIKNMGQYGIYIASTDASLSSPSLISNNSIGGGFTNTGTLANGIYITNSNYFNIYYNSINADGNNGRAINITGTVLGLRILNNSFAFNGSGNGYAAYINSTASVLEIDHNNYYRGNSSNFVYYGAMRNNLAALQAVNIPAGNDQNSVSGNPVYYDVTNLFPASSILNDAATPIPSIDTDITGALRDPVNPDIGAYEYTPAAIDAALLSIENVDPMHSGGSQLNLQVVIANWGMSPLTMIPIKYSINGGTPITETWIGNLAPYSTDVFNFATPFTIPNGTFSVCVYVDVPNDGNNDNDTICVASFGIPFLNLPFTDDFESSVKMFYTTGLINEWQHGQPTANVINSAYSLDNVWATNLSGNHLPTCNYNLLTPRFNFSNVSNVMLSFRYWIDTELDTDGGRVQFSVDGGQQWQTLGTVGDPMATNWYNSPNINGTPAFSGHSGGWVHATYDLTQFNNYPMPIQFRFNFYANGSGQHNGMAIDDFELTIASIPEDAGVVEILSPGSQSVVGTTENVEILIKNYGTDTLYTIPVRFRIGTGVPVQETWTGILAPGDTTSYTFTATVFEQSSYSLCAYTRVPNDIYFFNDTTCKFVSIVSAPYDIGVVEIVEPDLQTPHNNPVNISARVRNFGTEAVTEFDIAFDINAGTQTVETWTGVLAAGSEMIYDFTNTYISPLGNYILCVETQLPNDQNTANDRRCKSIGGVGLNDKDRLKFSLEQNMPNPAEEKTVISYYIPRDGQIVFKITNVLGQKVFEKEGSQVAGAHEIHLDTKKLGTGIYYYSLEFDNQRLVRKLVVN